MSRLMGISALKPVFRNIENSPRNGRKTSERQEFYALCFLSISLNIYNISEKELQKKIKESYNNSCCKLGPIVYTNVSLHLFFTRSLSFPIGWKICTSNQIAFSFSQTKLVNMLFSYCRYRSCYSTWRPVFHIIKQYLLQSKTNIFI